MMSSSLYVDTKTLHELSCITSAIRIISNCTLNGLFDTCSKTIHGCLSMTRLCKCLVNNCFIIFSQLFHQENHFFVLLLICWTIRCNVQFIHIELIFQIQITLILQIPNTILILQVPYINHQVKPDPKVSN